MIVLGSAWAMQLVVAGVPTGADQEAGKGASRKMVGLRPCPTGLRPWPSNSEGLADLKPGTGSTLKLSMDVRAYKLEVDGETVLEIDLVNAIRRIGGTDQLAEMRRAMGF